MKILTGGVTKPNGFKANGLACGIKRSGKADLSLIASDLPCKAAAVYTKNSIMAAPLVVTKKHLSNATAQAIISNSGNANCFTGTYGLAYAQKMADEIGAQLQIKPNDVIVASTGIIGKALPIAKISNSIPRLINGLSPAVTKGTLAAKAIMTTDTIVKECAVQISLGNHIVTLGGCAKGSGMIDPNMATMLAYITTDCAIGKAFLRKALKKAVNESFNCISIDGCMSTNDMVTILANGSAGNTEIKTDGKYYEKFYDALLYVCRDLATKIVKDGEGAKKFISINVTGAPSYMIAQKAAKAIANSNLVETAAYGKNANWGRIAAAVGSLGFKTTEKTLRIKTKLLSPKEITIDVDLALGKESATVWTCDLTQDYIRINSEYN